MAEPRRNSLFLNQGRGTANVYGPQTGKEAAGQFVNIDTRGVQELSKNLVDAAIALDPSGKSGDSALRRAIKPALKLIGDQYKQNIGRDVTGNLRKSVKTKYVPYPNTGGVVGIVGPRSTGTGSADERDGSGNHAWLVEWGTPPRRPGTNNRRTYVNVHRLINGKMKRHATSQTDEQFANASRGYYFLMSSLKEPTRQANYGSGYPHDFMPDGAGGVRPMTLHPGETYGGMKAKHPMRNAITAQGGNARRALEAALIAQVKKFTN
jgi:hypothetical protein